MKKSSVFEWHRLFKKGREDVQDELRSGQPKTQRTVENVDGERTLVRSGNSRCDSNSRTIEYE